MAKTEQKRLSDFPAVVSAEARLRELRNDYAECRTAYSAESAELQQSPAAVEILRQEAAALTTAGSASALRGESDIRRTMEELQHRCAVLSEAILQQRGLVDRARLEASKIICANVESDWLGHCKAIRAALRTLLPVIERERAFRQALADDGVVLSGRICDSAGLPNQEQTLFCLEQLDKNLSAVAV
ncbi:MAG: hypothetical protein LLG00_05005 [Planctomycetaceae bacterium]|nr:hypothetical protein [Planctomycetaceae bacterium]